MTAMPDPFATITEASAEVLEDIAHVLERRGADPQQHAIVRTYLADIPVSAGARILEVGCGTGAVTRMLAVWPGVAEAVGVDLSPVLVAKARALSAGIAHLSFETGDAKALAFPDRTFDVVVLHTLLSHCPAAEDALAETCRVLRPGGWVAMCDADFSSVTVACGDHDPLQACAAAFVEGFVHDQWLVRRLPALTQGAGLRLGTFRSYGYVGTSASGLLYAWVRRGADVLHTTGRIGPDLAEALKAEARRRADIGAFCGHVAYASLTAQKPA
jgi:ubiquinone/menaquinone biosynthesis C-methylase UbiE